MDYLRTICLAGEGAVKKKHKFFIENCVLQNETKVFILHVSCAKRHPRVSTVGGESRAGQGRAGHGREGQSRLVGGCLAGVGLAGAEQWCLPRKGGVRWSGWVVVVVVVC